MKERAICEHHSNARIAICRVHRHPEALQGDATRLCLLTTPAAERQAISRWRQEAAAPRPNKPPRGFGGPSSSVPAPARSFCVPLRALRGCGVAGGDGPALTLRVPPPRPNSGLLAFTSSSCQTQMLTCSGVLPSRTQQEDRNTVCITHMVWSSGRPGQLRTFSASGLRLDPSRDARGLGAFDFASSAAFFSS